MLEIFIDKAPECLVGTSNTFLALELGIDAKGTQAHQLPMGYSRLFGNSEISIRDSHHIFLQDWWNLYGKELSIALTDTFGVGFFFSNFTFEQANNYIGLRQDSGDPFEFGKKALDFYRAHNIDAKKKVLVFSDNLNIGKAIELQNKFGKYTNIIFGIGTNLTNDNMFDPLSIVIKLESINGLGVVKLSNDIGKATGHPLNIKRFKRIFSIFNRVE
jgi:nicotinate phosphoribosyltransferase